MSCKTKSRVFLYTFLLRLVPFPVCVTPLYEQIFNDLDVQDDKLMIDLAIFLNRLVSTRGCVVRWGRGGDC